MEPFPVLKRAWRAPENSLLREIKYQEDRLYYMSGQQDDETTRAYPEATNWIPKDEWPQELQEIWDSWEDEKAIVQEKIDGLYDEIIELEKEMYSNLDPLEIREMETMVMMYNPHLMNEKWGMAKLMESLDYKYKFFEYKGRARNPDLPAELVEVKFAGEVRMMQEVKRLGNMGIEWIEEQERMLLGLDTN